MTIIELRNKRGQKLAAAKAFLESNRTADGFLSEEDDAIYTRLENEITTLGNEIARMERLEALDTELSRPVSAPITAKPEPIAKVDEKTGRASDTYKKAFWNNNRRQPLTPEMKNALNEGADSEGGYLVPDEFESTLVQGLNANTIIRAHAHVITTSSGIHKIPVVASHGSAAWIDEEGAFTESDDSFGQVQLDAHKVGTLIKVSEELLNDAAFNLEAYITSEFVRRIGDKEEEAFLTGNGVSKPTGILNATGGGQVGVTTAKPTEITADELIDLYYSLKAAYRQNAMDEGTRNTILKIAAFVAAIGPALLVIGKLTTGVGKGLQAISSLGKGILTLTSQASLGVGASSSLGSALSALAGPVGIVIAVIAVLVAAFVHLWNTNEEFREKITAIWEGIKAKFQEFAQGIVDRLNALGFDFKDITEVLKALWDGFCSVLGPIFEGAFEVISAVLGTVLDVLTGLLDVFIGIFTGNWDQAWEGVKEIFSGVWEGIKGILTGVFDALKGITETFLGWFGTDWEHVWEDMGKIYKNVWEGIKKFFSNTVKGIKETASKAWDGIKSTAEKVWNAIKNTITGIVDGIKTGVSNAWNALKNAVTGTVNAIKSTVTSVWNAIKSTVVSVADGIKTAVSNAWNSLKSAVTDTVNAIKTTVTNVWNAIKDTVSSIATGIKTAVTNAWNTLKSNVENTVNAVKNTVTNVWNTIKTTVTNVATGIQTAVTNAWNTLKTNVTNTVNAISSTATSVWNSIKTSVTNIANGIQTGVTSTWNTLKTNVSNTINAISSTATSVWNSIKSSVTSIANGIQSGVTSAWNTAKSNVSNAMSGIQSTASSVWNSIKSTVSNVISGIGSSISSGFNSAKSTVSSIFESIKNSISNAINGAKTAVQNAINAIKSAFNFTWSLPKIKLPHITITGSFSLDPPSVPHFSIEWYRKAMENGMILNGPTIFGASGNTLLAGGEAGSETVVGTKSLLDMIRDAVADMAGGTTINYGGVSINLYATENQDIRALADEIEYRLANNITRRKAAYGQ